MRRYATSVARSCSQDTIRRKNFDSAFQIHRILLAFRPSASPRRLAVSSRNYTSHASNVALSGCSVSYSASTIYALSTAPGTAGIAIVRVSGSACLDIYHALCPSKPAPSPRYAAVRTLYDPNLPSNVLDSKALVLHFPAPATVTGEDVLEFHIHGGSATVKAVLRAIQYSVLNKSVRYAEPGEFTKRAFQNNRLDLAQVEALSDTLSAETEQQRRAAVKGNSGVLGRTYETWRKQLLDVRGELEALIDFSEDQYFDESNAELLKNVSSGVEAILSSVVTHEEASRRGELLRKGIKISMLGPPNVGKSSLLNRIVGREASIVNTEAGTTRDIVEVSLDIEGYLCTLADTAGLRSQAMPRPLQEPSLLNNVIGAVEEEGIRRAKLKAHQSDFIIALTSVEPTTVNGKWMVHYDQEAMEIAAKALNCVVAVNKVDVVSPEVVDALLEEFRMTLRSEFPNCRFDNIIGISCKDSAMQSTDDPRNIKSLITNLVKCFQNMTSLEHEDLLGVTERQRQLLSQCKRHLEDYLEIARESETPDEDLDIVLAAEHLRAAANCLSRITGRGDAGDVEEVLGVVFERFCVGK